MEINYKGKTYEYDEASGAVYEKTGEMSYKTVSPHLQSVIQNISRHEGSKSSHESSNGSSDDYEDKEKRAERRRKRYLKRAREIKKREDELKSKADTLINKTKKQIEALKKAFFERAKQRQKDAINKQMILQRQEKLFFTKSPERARFFKKLFEKKKEKIISTTNENIEDDEKETKNKIEEIINTTNKSIENINNELISLEKERIHYLRKADRYEKEADYYRELSEKMKELKQQQLAYNNAVKNTLDHLVGKVAKIHNKTYKIEKKGDQIYLVKTSEKPSVVLGEVLFTKDYHPSLEEKARANVINSIVSAADKLENNIKLQQVKDQKFPQIDYSKLTFETVKAMPGPIGTITRDASLIAPLAQKAVETYQKMKEREKQQNLYNRLGGKETIGISFEEFLQNQKESGGEFARSMAAVLNKKMDYDIYKKEKVGEYTGLSFEEFDKIQRQTNYSFIKALSPFLERKENEKTIYADDYVIEQKVKDLGKSGAVIWATKNADVLINNPDTYKEAKEYLRKKGFSGVELIEKSRELANKYSPSQFVLAIGGKTKTIRLPDPTVKGGYVEQKVVVSPLTGESYGIKGTYKEKIDLNKLSPFEKTAMSIDLENPLKDLYHAGAAIVGIVNGEKTLDKIIEEEYEKGEKDNLYVKPVEQISGVGLLVGTGGVTGGALKVLGFAAKTSKIARGVKFVTEAGLAGATGWAAGETALAAYEAPTTKQKVDIVGKTLGEFAWFGVGATKFGTPLSRRAIDVFRIPEKYVKISPEVTKITGKDISIRTETEEDLVKGQVRGNVMYEKSAEYIGITPSGKPAKLLDVGEIGRIKIDSKFLTEMVETEKGEIKTTSFINSLLSGKKMVEKGVVGKGQYEYMIVDILKKQMKNVIEEDIKLSEKKAVLEEFKKEKLIGRVFGSVSKIKEEKINGINFGINKMVGGSITIDGKTASVGKFVSESVSGSSDVFLNDRNVAKTKLKGSIVTLYELEKLKDISHGVVFDLVKTQKGKNELIETSKVFVEKVKKTSKKVSRVPPKYDSLIQMLAEKVEKEKDKPQKVKEVDHDKEVVKLVEKPKIKNIEKQIGVKVTTKIVEDAVKAEKLPEEIRISVETPKISVVPLIKQKPKLDSTVKETVKVGEIKTVGFKPAKKVAEILVGKQIRLPKEKQRRKPKEVEVPKQEYKQIVDVKEETIRAPRFRFWFDTIQLSKVDEIVKPKLVEKPKLPDIKLPTLTPPKEEPLKLPKKIRKTGKKQQKGKETKTKRVSVKTKYEADMVSRFFGLKVKSKKKAKQIKQKDWLGFEIRPMI